MTSLITIRPPDSPLEYRSLQEAQRRAWGIVDDSYLLPLSTMISVHHHGGLVLGAFSPDGKALGLTFGFLGRIERRIGLYSQLTGVVPEQQGTGLGTRLKLAQRDFCLAEGIDLVAWAFDPLQAGNARFNLSKLGATSRRFIPDMYGPRTDALNAGIPTDRIIAEWDIRAEPRPVLSAYELRELPVLDGSGGATSSNARRWLLEIPSSISELRRENPNEAEHWRIGVGKLLSHAFARGEAATGFIRQADQETGLTRYYYLMESGSART